MSWYYPPYSTRHTAMDPLRRQQQPNSSPQYQRLIDLINERFTTNSDSDWEDIRALRFTNEELNLATDHALNLYAQWLAEDLRVLWPLLGGTHGQDAENAIRDASYWLDQIARDRRRARDNVNAILIRLCKARWQLRTAANELDRAARR